MALQRHAAACPWCPVGEQSPPAQLHPFAAPPRPPKLVLTPAESEPGGEVAAHAPYNPAAPSRLLHRSAERGGGGSCASRLLAGTAPGTRPRVSVSELLKLGSPSSLVGRERPSEPRRPCCRLSRCAACPRDSDSLTACRNDTAAVSFVQQQQHHAAVALFAAAAGMMPWHCSLQQPRTLACSAPQK
jgi:hypothetical protein